MHTQFYKRVLQHKIIQQSRMFLLQGNTQHCPVRDISVMLPYAFTLLPSELSASPSRSDKEQQPQINQVSQLFPKVCDGVDERDPVIATAKVRGKESPSIAAVLLLPVPPRQVSLLSSLLHSGLNWNNNQPDRAR